MNNLDDLKEQLQEDAMTWHDGLERDRVNSKDMDTLCDIIIERVNEFKKNEKRGWLSLKFWYTDSRYER